MFKEGHYDLLADSDILAAENRTVQKQFTCTFMELFCEKCHLITRLSSNCCKKKKEGQKVICIEKYFPK